MTFPVGQEERIRALEVQVQQLMAHIDNLYRATGASTFDAWSGRAQAGPESDPALREMLAQRQLIEAIKRYRELTGVGLKEAKAAVEAMLR